MSNPQGPDRHTGRDTDATEQTGEIPAWGTPPPGGWGAEPESTGAWAPERDDTGAWAPPDPATGGLPGARQDGADPGWNTADPAAGGTGGWGAAPHDPAAGSAGGWGPVEQEPAAGGWGAAQQDGPAGASPQQAGALWGDEAQAQGDTWAVPTGRRRRRRTAEEPTDAVPASSPASAWAGDTTTAQPADGGGWGSDQPWAPPEKVQRPSTTRMWILAGGAALLVTVLALSAFVWPAWAVSRHLDQTALQAGVNQVLTESYGHEVGAVQCPDDVVVAQGTAFSCQAVVDGEQVEVPGLVTSDEGDYQVNRV
ncbi:DUF4333 domain-containing protein [Pseudonocardia sp. NPDC049635]|uniref:DUF4333 domain-containing protein n=1 Tax=Pseudonocardia sp. NPDC049635 TaxID=3155506 RepID=UPI0033F35F96